MEAGRIPAISVIVPVYNVERYLPACLDSLLVQTHSDFEIILVNDGSNDGSSEIIEDYVAENPERIRSFAKPNGGLADARNYGIDRANGHYLAFVDGDDMVTPDMLARTYERALSCEADLVVCGIENFSDGESGGTYYPEPDMTVFGHSLAQDPRLLYRVDASACNKLYASDLFVRSGVRFPVGLRFEDLPTVYRLLPFANVVEKVDAPLYRYRRDRSDSISGGYDARYLDLIQGLRLVDDAYAGMGIFDVNEDSLLRLHLTHLVAGRYPDLFLRADGGAERSFIAASFTLLDDVFPGWRAAGVVDELWSNPVLRFVSTHRWALTALCALPSRIYLGLLDRMGAFDPGR